MQEKVEEHTGEGGGRIEKGGEGFAQRKLALTGTSLVSF